MALKGVKVLEFCGLAPAPFCGKILADFGATVTRIDKVVENHLDVLQHGKRTLSIDLKDTRAQQLVRQLVCKHDVLIEPFRPGVMEKLNLGPDLLCQAHPGLIYARLTGFGQSGPLAKRAGHDINYAALSGVLSMLGQHKKNPTAPINVLADFAGGGLMCAMGICLALLERHNSGLGQVVDASMVEGAAYVGSWLFMSRSLPIWEQKRGLNVLDGGAYYYDTYETKDGKYMSVGALEPQFFEIFAQRLGLPQLSQFVDAGEQERTKCKVREAFLQKTQDEWSRIFEDVDACVYPVVNWHEVTQHAHNKSRASFEVRDNVILPKPAPRLSRTPGEISKRRPTNMALDDLKSLVKEFDLDETEIQILLKEHIVLLPLQIAKI